MSNPRLRIDLEKITHNARRALEIGRAHGVEVMGVTKGAAGIPTVAKAMLAGGIESLADSRLDNIARLRADRIQAPITLLRSPGPSDVARTVELADASLNSDVVIIHTDRICQALSNEAQRGSRAYYDAVSGSGFCLEKAWFDRFSDERRTHPAGRFPSAPRSP